MAEFVNFKVKENIPVNEVTSHFNSWFHTNGSAFELYDDRTDEVGMRHQAYQQYYNGVAVENCIIIVHSKNDMVSYINGDIMTSQLHPSNPVKVSKKKARKLAKADDLSNDEEVEQTIIYLQTKDGNQFYNAYKITDIQEDIYVDVQTGEILKRVPRIQQSSVCNGTTKYSGERTFDAEVSNTGYYIAADETRNINVCYALMDYRKSTYSDAYYFSDSNTDWNDYYLTSVTIESVNNNWWSGFLDNEAYPNLFITITDANDNVLYRSDYKDMSYTYWNQYPVIFNIGKMIRVPNGGGYKIKIYDQDTYSNDLGVTVTLTSNSIGTYSWGQSTSNVKGSFEITKWHPSIDVIWGLQQVYDYYLNVFNRRSFDNENAQLNAIIHNPTTGSLSEEIIRYSNGADYPYNNAFALCPNNKTNAFMHFGLGNEISSVRVGINTIGHEYTHLICAYRSLGNLEYQGESGALNESMADMMAKNIEHHVKPSTFTWRYGCDHMFNGDCTRNFENPWEKDQPKCYEGRFWVNPSSTDDNGGVHYNSGVSNHWYYILCEGKSGWNEKGYEYNVTGIGIEKAQRIVFRTLINYLPPQATFLEARNLTIQAAADLYGENSAEVKAVDEAWKAVGLGDMKNILKPGKYWIYTKRKNDDTHDWFMSADLGTASTKRFQADTLYSKSPYFMYDADELYLWDVKMKEDSSYNISNGDKYISWTSGNSATLSSSPTKLYIENDIDKGSYQVTINTNSDKRYLSLNNTNGNNYFAFYGNTGQQCDLYFFEYYPYDTVTVRAKVPANWNDEINVCVWRDGEESKAKVIIPTYKDGWYSYSMVGVYNVVFMNGNELDNDNNLSDTIPVWGDCCLRIGKEVSGRRGYTYVSCDGDDEPDEEEPKQYYIVAKRNTGNYYFLTPNKVSGKERLVAADTGTSQRTKIDTTNTTDDYLWTIIYNEGIYLQSNNGLYLSCMKPKTAVMDEIGIALNAEIVSDDGTIMFSYIVDESETRYLSLATSGNDFFVFYNNTNQFTHLYLLPKGKGAITSLDATKSETSTTKILRDGQILILRGEKVYTVTGQEVR